MRNKDDIARAILKLRLSQLIVNEHYKEGRFKIPIHLALGHEAIAVAVDSVMGEQDKLLLTHRNIAYNLARARALRPILDEYYLKPTGLAGGRLGSMNLNNPAKGIVYTTSILGNQFPVAVGVAMGNQVFKDGGAVLVLGGDGSMEEGSFYEGALMAKSLRLPILFLIENNEWSMATRIDERRHPVNLESFANSLGLRFERLEGNDVHAYIDRLGEFRQTCLGESNPICVEVIVSTLGDWRGPKTAEHPQGKFINYHSGPTPSIRLLEWPLIKETEEDPVFLLRRHYSDECLRTMAREQYQHLTQEVA